MTRELKRPRPLSPAPRSLTRSERQAERRFVWRVLAAAIGLHLVGGMIALTAVHRGAPPRPRLPDLPNQTMAPREP